VNAMHDSLNPLGGLVPMALMMLNTDFSGIGAGFLNMLVYIIVAVFLAGLMVGRTPEYLGKKVESKEVKLAMLTLLIHPLVICGFTAIFAATDWGAKTVANPGPHGFSEILYEVVSSAANNGSGFEGLADNNPPWNIGMGIVLLLGRYPRWSCRSRSPGPCRGRSASRASGTLHRLLTFGAMLLGTVLWSAPVVHAGGRLGPVADHLTTVKP
ncbi:MAG: potassium-transporting ATPase subunit KdpA, partial [Singulisphaera sp.]